MGFRTLAMSADIALELPEWFVQKHKWLHFGERDGKTTLPVSSRFETKFYRGPEEGLFVDLQRVLRELPEGHWESLIKERGVEFVLFHECDGITKVNVSAERIVMAEPTGWEKVEWTRHDYEDCSIAKTT